MKEKIIPSHFFFTIYNQKGHIVKHHVEVKFIFMSLMFFCSPLKNHFFSYLLRGLNLRAIFLKLQKKRYFLYMFFKIKMRILRFFAKLLDPNLVLFIQNTSTYLN